VVDTSCYERFGQRVQGGTSVSGLTQCDGGQHVFTLITGETSRFHSSSRRQGFLVKWPVHDSLTVV
jgi:hypothetical protein